MVEKEEKKSTRNKTFVVLFTVIAVIVVVSLVGFLTPAEGRYDEFAQCVAEKSTFYGAWWCPACQEQKTAFQSSSQYLNYVECSNEDETRTEECALKGITDYPTWVFEDSVYVGYMSLYALSQRTSCHLPPATDGNI